ncbi:MAG: sigma-70 family RNA polymerase sigma factor [Verrucomicrobiaceae bacterium]|nr:sigma-70 family RNA polymerase sigma factor [Verrucomicrobiaceae bacterium]
MVDDLEQASGGDADDALLRVASSELLPAVYDDLRKLARSMVAGDGLQTLTATALVHEAWLRFSKDDQMQWENRRHFFRAVAQAMRRILLNRIRDKHRQKRGGNHAHVSFDEVEIEAPGPEAELLAVDEALHRLAAEEPLIAEVVSLRYFAGLKWSEIADLTGVPERELNRLWEFARAWLKAEIADS